MKILVVHQHYLAPGDPGPPRFNVFARHWRDLGHDVTVIAGTLNLSTGRIAEPYRGRWLHRTVEDGITVWRCHVPESYARSYGGRAWAFLGFAASASAAALRSSRPDVAIVSSPPLPVVVPGWLAARARRRRVPWVFEVRDLWPESATTTGVLRPDGAVARALYGLERRAAGAADRIAVVTPAFRADMVRRGLAPEEKFVLVPNGADLDHFRPGPRDNRARAALGWGERTVVLYAGAHGRANALGQLLDAAERLRDRPDILIATVGDGMERGALEERVRRSGLANVAIHGPRAYEAMPEVLQACDVAAAVLQDNPTFRTVYPNKVFDAMASARPILLGIDGVARALVCDEAGAGVFVPPENGEALAAAIRALADAPARREALGRSGYRWVVANGSREAIAREYLRVLEGMVPAKAGGVKP